MSDRREGSRRRIGLTVAVFVIGGVVLFSPWIIALVLMALYGTGGYGSNK
ncbi:MAG: hypothetical protein QM747_18405 [Nocardioides sp.]